MSGHFHLLVMVVSRLLRIFASLLQEDLLQESGCVDDEVCFVLLDFTTLLELDLPLAGLLIPDCLLDGRAELDIFSEVVFLRRALDVRLDFRLVNVKL